TPSAANSADPKSAETQLRIVSVEAQQGGAFFMSGVSEPGAQLRLYLNDSFVASVVGGPDGRWSVKVDRGMSPGAYTVRADRVDAAGQASARVEAPFEYPAALASAAPSGGPVVAKLDDKAAQSAAAPKPAPAPGAPAAAPSQDARVDELRTARVERGDSLWRISRTIYGEGLRYTQIYDANTKQIRNPRLIYPGQVLVVPEKTLGGTTPRSPAR
ncbi:MAG: peptidoglycan-binding protein, partial [Hyphomicrobiales bacterium]|nr:peptidoglycan-binding protein [Hyphomicrobiales bacterium]